VRVSPRATAQRLLCATLTLPSRLPLRRHTTLNNLLSPVFACYLLQLLKRRHDTMLTSAAMELVQHLRGESRLWSHFSRHYNPLVRLMCMLGAFVPPPINLQPIRSFSSLSSGGVIRDWGDLSASPQRSLYSLHREDSENYSPALKQDDKGAGFTQVLSAPRGGGAMLLKEPSLSESFTSDFDFE
jgi:hypothetical protein